MARKDVQRKALLTHQMIQIADEITADKMYLCPLAPHPTRKCQTAHQMPAADLL